MARGIKQEWRGNSLHRNSLSEPEVKKGLLILLVFSGLMAGAVIGGLGFGYHWLCQSDFFHVTAIDISGNQEVSKDAILRMAGVKAHANLLAIDLEAIRARLEGCGWIKGVNLGKDWPSHLRIEVRERRPVAMLETASGLYYLDASGQPFAPLTGQAELDFPVITGLKSVAGVKGQAPKVSDTDGLVAALRFIRFAARGSSSLPAQNISELHFSDQGEVTMFLADRPFPILLGRDLGGKSYYRLAKVLYWLYKKREFQTVAYIRMDYMENKVLVGQEASPPGKKNG